MSSKIHHNTAKKAKKHGVELVSVENEFEARHDGRTLASHASASVALDKALMLLDPEGVAGKQDADLKRTNKAAAAIRAMIKPKAKKAKKPRRAISDEDGEDDEDGDGDEGKSIVGAKYKARYKVRMLKTSCSDDLAVQIAEHIKTKDEETGELRVDEVLLKRFAQANGCWDPKYAHLNVGMRRMNVVNRLRGKIRRDEHKVVWAR